jgi:hypothetical protein
MMALNPFYRNLVESGRLKLQKPAATPAAATAPTGSPVPNYALQAAQALRPRPVDQGGDSTFDDFSTFGGRRGITPESRRSAMNAVTRDRSEIGIDSPFGDNPLGIMNDDLAFALSHKMGMGADPYGGFTINKGGPFSPEGEDPNSLMGFSPSRIGGFAGSLLAGPIGGIFGSAIGTGFGVSAADKFLGSVAPNITGSDPDEIGFWEAFKSNIDPFGMFGWGTSIDDQVNTRLSEFGSLGANEFEESVMTEAGRAPDAAFTTADLDTMTLGSLDLRELTPEPGFFGQGIDLGFDSGGDDSFGDSFGGESSGAGWE